MAPPPIRRRPTRPPPRQPETRAVYPMMHSAHQKPFGPYPQDPKGDVDRASSGPVDMRGAADWRTVFFLDCGEFVWGQLVISCEAIASLTVAHATDVPAWPWVEVRLEMTINGESFVYLESAVGSHNSAATTAEGSAGPIVLTFGPGEVPDRMEVKARARRGGRAELAGDADERLALTASSRFHR